MERTISNNPCLLLNYVYFLWGMNCFSRKICIFAAILKSAHNV